MLWCRHARISAFDSNEINVEQSNIPINSWSYQAKATRQAMAEKLNGLATRRGIGGFTKNGEFLRYRRMHADASGQS
jgi:hypothetical protein